MKSVLGSVELVNSGLGISCVIHGDESVTLLGDVDVRDGAELRELLLQKVLRAGAVDSVDEKLGSTRHVVET